MKIQKHPDWVLDRNFDRIMKNLCFCSPVNDLKFPGGFENVMEEKRKDIKRSMHGKTNLTRNFRDLNLQGKVKIEGIRRFPVFGTWDLGILCSQSSLWWAWQLRTDECVKWHVARDWKWWSTPQHMVCEWDHQRIFFTVIVSGPIMVRYEIASAWIYASKDFFHDDREWTNHVSLWDSLCPDIRQAICVHGWQTLVGSFTVTVGKILRGSKLMIRRPSKLKGSKLMICHPSKIRYHSSFLVLWFEKQIIDER